MKLSIPFVALALLSVLFASTAGAHDPDEMNSRFPTLNKQVSTPVTCAELAVADKNKLNQSDLDIQALNKQCKAEAAAKVKAAEAAKKKPAKKTK